MDVSKFVSIVLTLPTIPLKAAFPTTPIPFYPIGPTPNLLKPMDFIFKFLPDFLIPLESLLKLPAPPPRPFAQFGQNHLCSHSLKISRVHCISVIY